MSWQWQRHGRGSVMAVAVSWLWQCPAMTTVQAQAMASLRRVVAAHAGRSAHDLLQRQTAPEPQRRKAQRQGGNDPTQFGRRARRAGVRTDPAAGSGEQGERESIYGSHRIQGRIGLRRRHCKHCTHVLQQAFADIPPPTRMQPKPRCMRPRWLGRSSGRKPLDALKPGGHPRPWPPTTAEKPTKRTTPSACV